MKTTIASIILLIAPVFCSAQEGKNFIDQPYIEVTGKADMEVVPDEIYLTIRISELDTRAKQPLRIWKKR
jgi:uncharacterized protein YggE